MRSSPNPTTATTGNGRFESSFVPNQIADQNPSLLSPLHARASLQMLMKPQADQSFRPFHGVA